MRAQALVAFVVSLALSAGALGRAGAKPASQPPAAAPNGAGPAIFMNPGHRLPTPDLAGVPGTASLPPLQDITAIAAGGSHTCALTRGGGVKCWGRNGDGQLGDGTTTDRSTPVDVVGLGSGITAIAVGGSHTCALTSGGVVKCWGRNGDGQLGDGTTTDRSTPVDVVRLGNGVAAIAAGGSHTCALTSSGGGKCWGQNRRYGQLGDGTRRDSKAPVDVVGLGSGITAIAAGGEHTCALTRGGGVKCWGANLSGQLGDGTTTWRSTPADVVGLGSGITAIAAGGSHTCALTSGGVVKCWGRNGDGQLGDGTTADSSTPLDVVALGSGVAAIAAGGSHTCALTSGGVVKCWGRNYYGQLGDGTTADSSTPLDVVALGSGVAAIAAGGRHTCAMTSGGGVKCWGWNYYGQLGDGTTTWRSMPADVLGLGSGVAAIAAGWYHTCALTSSGGGKCWGANSSGQLGDGTTTWRSTPADVVGLGSGVAAIAPGYSHTCALTGGGVQCWGRNGDGQLGDGTTTDRSTPVDVVGLASGVAAIAAGGSHTCALTSGGVVKCWGRNGDGQLGDGTTADSSTPLDVVALGSGVAAIAAGWDHTCALTGGGGGKCWGQNRYDQLGDGTTADRSTPVDVVGLGSGVAAIAAGWGHTCALTGGGGVKCWGWNWHGQLGDGTTTDRSTPVDVVGLASGVAAIAPGYYHTCALTSGGGVQCWGDNEYGQLGDGTRRDSRAPVAVVGLANGVAAITAGGEHTCALTSGGGVQCWGANSSGQLGDGTTTSRSTPVDVVTLLKTCLPLALKGH